MKRIVWIFLGVAVGSFLGPLGLIFGGIIGFFISNIAVGDSAIPSCNSNLDYEPNVVTNFSQINPATGWLMIGGVDIAGNPYGTDLHDIHSSGISGVNPATGLPMIGDNAGGIDVGGSPYGTDLNNHLRSGIDDSIGTSFDDSLGSIGSPFDDNFGSIGSSFDDSFGSIGSSFDDSFGSIGSSFDDSFSSSGLDNDW